MINYYNNASYIYREFKEIEPPAVYAPEAPNEC